MPLLHISTAIVVAGKCDRRSVVGPCLLYHAVAVVNRLRNINQVQEKPPFGIGIQATVGQRSICEG